MACVVMMFIHPFDIAASVIYSVAYSFVCVCLLVVAPTAPCGV